jgi:hypothetical protein
VLDFFEQVWTAYRFDCLDKNLVYSSFSHDAENWWAAMEEYVQAMRASMNELGVYGDFEAMVKSLQAAHPNDRRPTKESVKQYIKDESELPG